MLITIIKRHSWDGAEGKFHISLNYYIGEFHQSSDGTQKLIKW
jgi:hypothetical protein